jgi:hypothetical protein
LCRQKPRPIALSGAVLKRPECDVFQLFSAEDL